jgi:hypothetical protein
MNTDPVVSETPGRLLAEIICPNCWHRSVPERLLFIERHDSLLGDDVVGGSAYRRFLPTRFNLAGNAIDARGIECQDLACPRCHLQIARPLIELQPLFISIVGAPASGKSYFLAAMNWEMRSRAAQLGIVYADGDPAANIELQRYEESLFLSANGDLPIEIRKTEESGSELYQTIRLDGQIQSFPRPFVFSITPAADHPRREDPNFPYRSVVLYDNAGESFRPGADSAQTPMTQHVAQSAAILFLFDPTQDARFRQRCRSDDPQLKYGLRPDLPDEKLLRQEILLNELASRVRKFKGLGQAERHRRPLIVILAKADIWIDLIDASIDAEPIITDPSPRLDIPAIHAMSDRCRQLMRDLCPEIVSAAEGFSRQVLYIPVSALGTSPELVQLPGRRFYGIRPRNVKPKWVAAPLLWSLAHNVPDLIPTAQ